VRGTDRKLIALFGPRGLSSLLLVLLPVFAGVRGAERLFTITALVVLLSLVVHGAIIGFYLRRTGDRLTPATSAPPAANSVPEKITIEEMRELQGQSEPTILVDARAIKSYLEDDRHAVGAVRLPPEDPVRTARARRLDQHATLVVYCA
jgi:hypothetical protein